jgi:hypothetical protein
MGAKHTRTRDLEIIVECLASFGHRQEEIAAHIGISVDTLFKYYADIMQTARLNKVMKIADSLYQSAIKGNVNAQIFFLKVVGRWSTEDSRLHTEANENIAREIKSLRDQLDAKNQKEY